ncbi:tetratricopeptide repeat protein [Candidatus Microgenomates bacterium]|nr:tetratricopeptide repeat protein [Candidatus Microgenomates bacterium]
MKNYLFAKHNITLTASLLLIIIVGLFIYSKTLSNSFVWDNIPQIVNNPDVQTLNLKRIFTSSAVFPHSQNTLNYYYKPVMYAVFALLYSFFQENVIGYHLLQVIIHIANAVLVLLLMRKYFKPNLALFLSLIFLVHPLNYETAGYLAALQDTLFFFFGFLALVLVHYEKPRNNVARSSCIGILILLSLLSKETGLLCVIAIGAYEWLYKNRKDQLIFLVTTVVTLIAYAALRINASHTQYGFLNASTVMKLPLYNRLLAVPLILSYYLITFILPFALVIDQQWTVNGPSLRYFIAPLMVVCLFIALVFWIGKRAGKSSTETKAFRFFLVLFVSGIAFHIHILMPLDMTVADRWFYVPMVGLLGLMGLAVQRVRLNKTLAIGIAIVIIGLLSLRTFVRGLDWTDMMTLYTHDLEHSPNNYHLANKYAAELLKDSRYDEARPILEQAYLANNTYGPVNNNLAFVYEKSGQYDKAREHYIKALSAADFGDADKSYNALARIELFTFNNPAGAKKWTEKGLTQYPESILLRIDLAMEEYGMGNKTHAIAILRKLNNTQRIRDLQTAMEKNISLK